VIVVDSNIIAYLYLTNAWTDQAERLLRRDPDWAAPLLWRSEFRNVLALYLRKRLLTSEDALEIIEQATAMMLGREYDVVSSRVLSLVAQSSCSAYDCEFVALAQDLGVPLVTMDKQILDQFPKVGVSLDKYLASHRG
jgi:predicted nucleic acid-binding protein